MNYDLQTKYPDRKSVGVNLCFLHIKFFLSAGAFFEHPRANTVRPYRVSGDFSAKNITPLRLAFFLCIERLFQIRLSVQCFPRKGFVLQHHVAVGRVFLGDRDRARIEIGKSFMLVTAGNVGVSAQENVTA